MPTESFYRGIDFLGNSRYRNETVGIMVDGTLMVHANAHHMMVAVEPLSEAARRIAKTGAQISAIKRLELQDVPHATA